ncbi:MarR family winged helix-turn-helix transcriptional regulator [Cupriavidus basilensis]|uniref:MarR family winged helix-turn-helix transcriptional regulator n=1 Tax=Cupriavidus basilensis TaxID=68895 RepID=UPI000750EDAB|nr:MarR family transcriptional regulator [Cupriavidus basilensis]
MSTTEVERLSQLYSRPGFLLRRAHQISVAIFEDSFAALELTPSQYAVLIALHNIERASQNDVARALGVNKVSVSQVAQSLEERGWVTRETSADDRRQRQLALSAKGRKALSRSMEMADAAYDALMAPFDAAERRQFIALLQRVVTSLEPRARTPFAPAGA